MSQWAICYSNRVKRLLIGLFRGLNNLLNAPQKVVWVCLGLVVLNLVLDGSLVRLWSLRRDYDSLQSNIQSLNNQNQKLKSQLIKAKDPVFLEREARDRFDLVSEGDLVFVFSDEGEP